MNCLVSEDITTVELNEKINTDAIFRVPGVGASELKSLHMAGHLTSSLSQLSQEPGI